MQMIVKLSHAFLYCCMVVLLCLQQESYAVPFQGKPVSITIKNSSLADVLRQVSKKSGLYIYFQDADLAGHKNVSLDVKNRPVENVLHELLDERGFAWVEVSENTIAVKKKFAIEEHRVDMDTVKTITVTGKVVDEKGEPVIGATVQVKGSNMGTITSTSGDFVLNDIKTNASIVVTNVSFVPEEIPVKGRRTIGRILLKGKVGELDEIVVIPYGTTTKRLTTSSIVSIKKEEIEMQPVNNPLYALQGRVAGLQVTPTTGVAGGAVNIQIRGKNSLNFKSEPLVVVDGLPIVNNIPGLDGPSLYQISSLSFINPNEIESIDVLKDADATSIYGSRGANGVILITTKKGKKGATKIDINAQTGWATVPKRVSLMNTPQYIEMRREAFTNSGVDFVNTHPYGIPEYKYQVAPDLFIWDQNRYTDWQKELLGNAARYNDFQGNISGGGDNIAFDIGGNFHKETTVFAGDNSDQKGSGRMSLTGTSNNKKFQATVTASYMIDKNTLPGVDFTRAALTLAPNAPSIYNEDGSLNWAPQPSGNRSWTNPYAELSKTYESKITNLLTSANLSYTILPGLTARTTLGYSELNGKSFRKTFPFAGRAPEDLQDPFASSAFNTNSVRNLNIEPQLNYSLDINEGNLDVLLGGSIQHTNNEAQVINASGFQSDALLKNLSSAASYIIRNTSSQYKYAAVFGRITYNFKKEFIVNMNVRRDGSSRFGPGNQFGSFASVGAAWIFTQQSFIKNNLKALSFGKIRFSYGSSGNDGITDYAYFERYGSINASDPYQGTRGYTTLGLYNTDYAWETTKKTEYALELGFWEDRLFFTGSHFRNKSNNQLVVYPYPSMAGFGVTFVNSPALVQNTGIEFIIRTENIKNRQFTWSTSFNFTRNRNKLLSFPDLEKSASYGLYEIGRPFYGELKAFKSAGIDPKTGQYQFLNSNGTITLDPSEPDRLDYGQHQRIFTEPKFYGGLSNTFSYKGFSLDVFLQFTKQTGTSFLNEYVNTPAGFLPINLPSEYLQRWRSSEDASKIAKVYGTFSDEYFRSSSLWAQSDANYVDASFIRLKNLSLSYSIPEIWKNRLHVNNVKVYLHAQNLITLTNYRGLDPETQTISALPPLRTLSVGIQISL
ncbi:SusC/RagA family TonB-linked outer membrane protein [Chitinophaga rhizophila]|uniref:SusC/RagA family TonB-linked outer membrane protein n=1 Tax=Chitinophaga rhizophila TaxID=2866212 RepID=A0ABS7GE59_9BACT|nr:SusC/RagA family TonB-linked outer membrane protein [Chitinophaga rhizophila]MBW8685575.1 SusC/RagA family TonB-linked outer membrane protein [Chitinophaga rhizophila]